MYSSWHMQSTTFQVLYLLYFSNPLICPAISFTLVMFLPSDALNHLSPSSYLVSRFSHVHCQILTVTDALSQHFMSSQVFPCVFHSHSQVLFCQFFFIVGFFWNSDFWFGLFNQIKFSVGNSFSWSFLHHLATHHRYDNDFLKSNVYKTCTYI